MIRRRQVFFIQGYDPKGSRDYYNLLKREWNRFCKTWSVTGTFGPFENHSDADDVAHCVITADSPQGPVETRYEFLRIEKYVGPNIAKPLWRQIARTMRWSIDDIVNGAISRLYRVSWNMAALLLYSQVMLYVWLALTVAGGALAAMVAAAYGFSGVAVAVAGIAAAAAIFLALWPLAYGMYVLQLNSCWSHLRDVARGPHAEYDRLVEVFAERIVAAARAGEVDEIVIVGHSVGGMTGITVLARALELDPKLGQHGTPVVLLTLGSVMGALALHPAAERMRREIRRVALEPSVPWVDCQAYEDMMNFWDYDPVAGGGVEVGAARCNPYVWIVPVEQMLTTETYRRMRWNYWRRHYQYIMANDLPSSYDYFRFICGPTPVMEWVARSDAATVSEASEIGSAAAADRKLARSKPAVLLKDTDS